MLVKNLLHPNQIVHVCLFIEAYRKNVGALSRDLMQPPFRIAGALATLERLGIIKKELNEWLVSTSSLHLKSLSPVYRSWRNQLKIMSSTRLDMLRESDSYSFANVFSADRLTVEKLRVSFLHFLKEADTNIKSAPDQNVYQMSFDLFPWTERKE